MDFVNEMKRKKNWFSVKHGMRLLPFRANMSREENEYGFKFAVAVSTWIYTVFHCDATDESEKNEHQISNCI